MTTSRGIPAEEAQKALAEDLDHVWHPLLQHKMLRDNPPLLMVAGHGATVVDAEGREYLDAFAGLWCVNVGYGRTEIADAAYEQLRKLAYYPHTQANVPAALLADRVSRLAGMEHTYFVNSGSEANEAAFKLARQYHKNKGQPERYKIIGRYYAYHGTTLATLSAGGLPERRVKYEPMPDGFLHAPPAYCYRCPFGQKYPSCGLACARYIEYMIEAEGPETVAAIVMEPIQSGAGVLVPPDEYLPTVADIARRHGVLLIIDEVINGFGRTGRWFAHQHYGIRPDLMAVAKGISSGYLPLAATLATDEVFQGFLGDPAEGRHAMQVNTWGGHAGACAAALKNIELMEREDLVGNAERVGAHLIAGLRSLSHHRWFGEVRGKGLLAALELVEDPETRRPLPGALLNRIAAACQARGVIAGKYAGWSSSGVGTGTALLFSPPLVLTREEADRIVAVVDEALCEAGG